MKNYKILIISLLLLVFMVGAVTAADGNAILNDDDPGVFEEDVQVIDVDDEGEVVLDPDVDDEGEVVLDPDVDDGGEVVLDPDDEDQFVPEFKLLEQYSSGTLNLLEGDLFNFTIQFLNLETPYANENILLVANGNAYSGNQVNENYELTTDNNGFATVLIELPAGEYKLKWTTSVKDVLIKNIWILDKDAPSSIEIIEPNHVSEQERYGFVYGDDSIVNINIFNPFGKNRVNSTIEYVIGSMSDVIEGTEGNYNLNITSLPVGIYNLTVHCPEINMSKTVGIYIFAEPVRSVIADNLTMVYGDGSKLIVKLTDECGIPLVNQFSALQIVWDRISTNNTDEEGIAYHTINLPVGVYKISVPNYNTHEEIICTVTVLAESSIVENNVSDDADNISATFCDINGTALASSDIKFLVGDETYDATTDENGIATFDLSVLGLGEYNITILNPVTGQKVTKSVSLTTNETVFAGDANATYKEGSKFTANFTDKYGKALANATVTFAVDGQEVNATTDENGVASFDISFGAGVHNLAITNPATGEKVNTVLSVAKAQNTTPGKVATGTKTTKTASSVKKVKPKLTAKKKVTFKAKVKVKKLTITLKNGKKALKKVKVTLKVKGKTYKATTNAKGKAIFKIKNLKKKGKYTAKIKFAGNKNFKAVTKSVKIIVK